MRGSDRAHTAAAIRYPRRNVIAIGLLLSITALALIALFKLVTLDPTNDQASSFVTITGTPTCLPHKNTSGPTTLECALGLKGDDGRYYDLTGSTEGVWDEDGSRVQVKGVLTEPSANNIYAISGILTVTSVSKQ